MDQSVLPHSQPKFGLTLRSKDSSHICVVIPFIPFGPSSIHSLPPLSPSRPSPSAIHGGHIAPDIVSDTIPMSPAAHKPSKKGHHARCGQAREGEHANGEGDRVEG